MPSVSEAQHSAMEAAAHGHSTLGIPARVGKEFIAKDDAPQAAGVVFVAPDGDVLLLLRSSTEENYASHWALPGGKADAGEAPEQAAQRECREEMGDVPDGKLKLLDRKNTPNGMVFSTFAQPVAEKFAPVLNDEHAGFAWCPLDKLPTPIHPSVKAVLGEHIGAAQDMSPQDWEGLRSGFAKWTREEEGEPEHAHDEAHDTDAYGRIHLTRVPITKAAVNDYRGSEIPGWQGLGLEANKIYALFRDPAEIKKGLSSANGIQLLIKHTPVDANDHKPFDIVGCLGTNAEFEDPYLYNDITVWSQQAINGIEDASRRELSASYGYKPVLESGTYKSLPFVIRMTEIEFNHVAVIPNGRVGPDCAIDELSARELAAWIKFEQAIISLAIA